jgi:hypothetical protein
MHAVYLDVLDLSGLPGLPLVVRDRLDAHELQLAGPDRRVGAVWRRVSRQGEFASSLSRGWVGASEPDCIYQDAADTDRSMARAVREPFESR